MGPLHIALVTNSYYPHIGGVETAVQEIGRELVRKGHRVTVITARNPLSAPAYEKVDGLPVHRVPMFMPGVAMHGGGRQYILAALKLVATPVIPASCLYTAVRIFAGDLPDLVNVHYIGGNALCGIILSRLLRVPLVVNIHGEDIARDPVKSRLCRILVRFALGQSQAVLCNSAYLQQLAVQIAPAISHKSEVVGNGVRLEEFERVESYISNVPYIFGIGRFVHKKGFDRLILAFAQAKPHLGNAKLVLAGDGPDRADLQQLAATCGAGGNIEFPGLVNHHSAISLMKGAQIVVVPSRREPFGIVAVEAMAAGTPVIATAVGGLAEIIRDGGNGILVPDGRPDEMAEAMQMLWQQPAIRAKLAAEARRTVEARYTWSQVTQRMLEQYRNVLASCGGT